MAPGVGRSLTSAGYSSLGSLARNALLSDLVEALCWPLESVIDRGRPFGPFRAVLCALSRSAMLESWSRRMCE
jgi:hypothetical protein